jgi:hypothetical protein
MDHVMHHMRRDCLFYFHVEPVGQNLLDARFAIYISPALAGVVVDAVDFSHSIGQTQPLTRTRDAGKIGHRNWAQRVLRLQPTADCRQSSLSGPFPARD